MLTRYHESGFTLLEIIVVMVIVATLATLAALSIGSLGRHDSLDHTAQQITFAVDLGTEEAALNGYPVGLDLRDGGYNFQMYRNGEWQLLQRGKLFERYEFEAHVDVSFGPPGDTIESLSAQNNDETQPTLVFLPDGERWLRAIALYDSKTGSSITLSPDAGNYQVEASEQ